MGWFLKNGRSPAADPRQCVVSVLHSAEGTSVGAGVLVTPDQLLTCAHVVNDALGRAPFDHRPPLDHKVRVVLHGSATTTRYDSRVAYWVPPRRRDGSVGVRMGEDHEWLGDLAVLRLETLPGRVVTPPRWLRMEAGQLLRAWHSEALNRSFADGRVKTCDEEIGYVDGEPTGMPIGPSFSGGPLWSVQDDAVVGIVAGAIMPPADAVTGRPLPYSPQHIARRSWGIPWQRIEAELRTVGATELFETREADPDDPALPLLVDLLERAFPSPSLLGDHARAVATTCGYGCQSDVAAPTPEEFAGFLVTEPRALAALIGVLRRHYPAVIPELVAAGRLSPVPRLLSLREHRRLTRILDDLPRSLRARLPEVVRAALPLAVPYPGGDTVAGLLDHLEQLPGDSRTDADGMRVPGLLRVIEYLAAVCPSRPRSELRLWANGVIDRLGVPATSLAERRSDAEEWARAQRERTAPARVLARLDRAGADRYRLRVWCDDGTGPRQTSVNGEAVHSAEGVAGELLRILHSLHKTAPDSGRPVLELHVDREGLNLPVDEWLGSGADASCGIPDDLPSVLGAEYPVVVTSPELLHRHERFHPDWRHRWRLLDTGLSLTFDNPGLGRSEVYGALLGDKDVVRVSVDVPPRSRDVIVQTCLMMGVPVVVWDRDDGRPRSHAVARLSAVPVRDVPESVRAYRAKSLGRPQEYSGKPVVAWSDPNRAVPRLHLAEPQETA
ncbi:trypsin-like peptidase domain-containing protein [Streptomyces sp. NPDC052682]|uniref:VMAP-C domain-containing protein n=1 Tax=Streptomyces sp. NPDC052682 TaxID=3154954 RepID=UPI00343C7B61